MANITVTIPATTVKYVDTNSSEKHKFIDKPIFKGLSIFGQKDWFYTVENTGGFAPSTSTGGAPSGAFGSTTP